MDNASKTNPIPQTNETSVGQLDSQPDHLDSGEELNQVYKRISRVREIRRWSSRSLTETQCRPESSRTKTFPPFMQNTEEGPEDDFTSSGTNDMDWNYRFPTPQQTPPPRPIISTERPATPSRKKVRRKTEDFAKWKDCSAEGPSSRYSGITSRYSYDPSKKRNSWYEEMIARRAESSRLRTPPLSQDPEMLSKCQEAHTALQTAINPTGTNSVSQPHRPSLPRKRMVGSNHHKFSQSVDCVVTFRNTGASEDGFVDQKAGRRHSNSIDRYADSEAPETPDSHTNDYVPSRLEILEARRRDTSMPGKRVEVTYPEAAELRAIQQDIAERTLKAEREAQKQGWKGKYHSMTERVSKFFLCGTK